MTSLLEEFDKNAEKINASVGEPWEHVCISKGFAVFNPSEESTVTEVMQHADKLMYENKRARKSSGKGSK